MLKERKQFLSTILITIFLSSIGFSFLYFDLVEYGFTFFIIIPLCIGFFLGKRPSWKFGFTIALIIGLIAFLFLLITAQLEFFFCIVILFPLILVLTLAGALLGWGIRERIKNKNKSTDLKLSFYPLLILLFSAVIEHSFFETKTQNEVVSKIFLQYPKETVFDNIKSVDSLNTEKPLLMNLGLPVPQKCILEKEEVGAMRVCHFAEGTIEEKVTEIKRGEILKMDVTKFGLPGLKWLHFREAIYLFETKDAGTELTRITTYTTKLRPRFYWKFWERKSIEAEHEYVFRDLKRRLEEKQY